MALRPNERIAHDLILAKQICEKLRSGERKCLDDLFNEYNSLFQNFARRRLFNPTNYEDVVQSFWAEILSGHTICAYAQSAENKATLRTYLLGVLHRRIIDANRKTSTNRKIHQEEGDLNNKIDQSPTPHNGLVAISSENLARRLVHEALLKLSEDSPLDASLVRMHLEGLNYREIAQRLGKRTDAIRGTQNRGKRGEIVPLCPPKVWAW